jgi:hypothetical protein
MDATTSRDSVIIASGMKREAVTALPFARLDRVTDESERRAQSPRDVAGRKTLRAGL